MTNYDPDNGPSPSSTTPENRQASGLIGRSAAGYGQGALTTYSAPPDSIDGGGSGSIGFSRYIHALRRRWLLSLVIALPLAAGVGYAAWGLQPPMYTATAVLKIKPAGDHLLFMTADQAKGGAQGTFDSFKRSQRVMLRQRYVIERALAPHEHEGLLKYPVLRRAAPDEVAWLEKHITVTYPEDGEIMYVSLTADDPAGLHEIVNSIVDEYYDEVVTSERRRKLDRLNNLDMACKEAEKELRRKRNELRQLVDRVGHADKSALTTKQQSALQEYSTFMQHFTRLKFELLQEQSALEHREKLVEKSDGEIEISESELLAALAADPQARFFENEHQSLINQIEGIKSRTKPEKAAEMIKDATAKLAANENKMTLRKAAVRAALAERLRIGAEAEIDELRKKVAFLTMQKEKLDAEALVLDAKAKDIGRSSIEVEMMQSEISAHATITDNLRAELARTKVEMQSAQKNNEIEGDDAWAQIKKLNKAFPARANDSKTRLTTTVGVACLTFAFPFVCFVLLDASKNRISTGAEVTHAVGLSVIGAVPILPQRVMRRLGGPSENDKYWRTLLSESVDSIAAVLLKGTQSGSSRVIMVSSANAGEGKTTLASHLAVSLAGAGRHPVLVDFDLRRPALHRVFGVSLQPGVNEVLRNGHDLESALQATQIPNLMMLSAGRASKLGLGGLVASDLQTLFNQLRSEFDFIIVDACPILPVVDTRLIGQHVDAVLLSVLRDVSRAPKLRAACDLLDMFRIPILGVVVTGSSEELYKDARYASITEAQPV